MPKETIATTDIYNGDEAHTNILKVAWGANGDCPEAPDGWVNAGYAHLYIGTKEDPFLGSVELGEDEIDHLIRVLKRVKRQAFRASRTHINGVNLPAAGGVGITWTASESLVALTADALAKHARRANASSVGY